MGCKYLQLRELLVILYTSVVLRAQMRSIRDARGARLNLSGLLAFIQANLSRFHEFISDTHAQASIPLSSMLSTLVVDEASLNWRCLCDETYLYSTKDIVLRARRGEPLCLDLSFGSFALEAEYVSSEEDVLEYAQADAVIRQYLTAAILLHSALMSYRRSGALLDLSSVPAPCAYSGRSFFESTAAFISRWLGELSAVNAQLLRHSIVPICLVLAAASLEVSDRPGDSQSSFDPQRWTGGLLGLSKATRCGLDECLSMTYNFSEWPAIPHGLRLSLKDASLFWFDLSNSQQWALWVSALVQCAQGSYDLFCSHYRDGLITKKA